MLVTRERVEKPIKPGTIVLTADIAVPEQPAATATTPAQTQTTP